MDTPFFYGQETPERVEFHKAQAMGNQLTMIEAIVPIVKFLMPVIIRHRRWPITSGPDKGYRLLPSNNSSDLENNRNNRLRKMPLLGAYLVAWLCV